jgi:hypothetical protein
LVIGHWSAVGGRRAKTHEGQLWIREIGRRGQQPADARHQRTLLR